MLLEQQQQQGSSKLFTFDAVFSDQSTQRKIYDSCAAPVVQSVLEGYNGTIFAYGQTGAGKVRRSSKAGEREREREEKDCSYYHCLS